MLSAGPLTRISSADLWIAVLVAGVAAGCSARGSAGAGGPEAGPPEVEILPVRSLGPLTEYREIVREELLGSLRERYPSLRIALADTSARRPAPPPRTEDAARRPSAAGADGASGAAVDSFPACAPDSASGAPDGPEEDEAGRRSGDGERRGGEALAALPSGADDRTLVEVDAEYWRDRSGPVVIQRVEMTGRLWSRRGRCVLWERPIELRRAVVPGQLLTTPSVGALLGEAASQIAESVPDSVLSRGADLGSI